MKRKRRAARPSQYNGDAALYRGLLAAGVLLAILAIGVVLVVLSQVQS